MENLNNWTEITKGLYRYVIAANVCYEIHLIRFDFGTDPLTAKANLFIVGDWYDESGSFFERECLLSEKTLQECIEFARKDNEENNG